MKTTTVTPALPLLAALFITLSLAFACGDDDGGDANGASGSGDTLAGYFTNVHRIFQDAEDATNEAERRSGDAPSETLDERLATMDTYLGEIDAIFSEAIVSLEDLDVPSAAADGHRDFIQGVRDSVAAGSALQDDLPGISTKEQLDERLDEFESDIDAAVAKADTACLELQGIADAEAISIDLDCED